MKYVKTYENFNGELLQQDITVYISDNKSYKNNRVAGRCYFDSMLLASEYGSTVFFNVLKKGIKFFDFDNYPNPIPDSILYNPDKIRKFLLEKQYDVVRVKSLKGIEYIILDTKIIGKDQYMFKCGWSDNYDSMEGEPVWSYYNGNNQEIYWILSPVTYDKLGDMEIYRNKFLLFNVEKGSIINTFDSPESALRWFDENIISNSYPL